MTESVASGLNGAASHDAALIELARDGSRAAFDDLIQARLAGLYRTAFAILRHDADARDAVQESCLQAWRELGRLREPDRFDAWIGRIILNACRATLRTRRRASIREITVAEDTGEGQAAAAADFSDRVASVDAIRRAFERLAADYRILLGLHYGQHRSIEEIAELIGSPQGTVKWRLHRARQALTRAMERER